MQWVWLLAQGASCVISYEAEIPIRLLILIFNHSSDCSSFPGSNACQASNGGCGVLCLAVPGGRRCACADDQLLSKDNVSCTGESRVEEKPRSGDWAQMDWSHKDLWK